eukprot:g24663.t1
MLSSPAPRRDSRLKAVYKNRSESLLLDEQQQPRNNRHAHWVKMLRGAVLLLLLALLLALAWTAAPLYRALQQQPAQGDTQAAVLYYNGRVHTGQPVAPQDTCCFVIQAGMFRAVGTSQAELTELFPGAVRVDLQQAIVVPGLADSHTHIAGLGLSLRGPALFGLDSLQATLQAVVDWAAEHHTGGSASWITGTGWDQTRWGNGDQFPTKEDLDAYFPDTPVMLARTDGHAMWLNSACLRLAALPAQDPPGGQVVRDAQGKPTGILLDNAQKYITDHQPPTTDQEYREALLLASAEYARLGVTALHDAGVPASVLTILTDLIDKGQFAPRVFAMLSCEDQPDKSYQTCGEGRLLTGYGQEQGRGPLLEVRAVKVFLDGALGSWGAAMLQPYSDKNDSSGLLMYQPDQYADLTRPWTQAGWQVCTHAIGDQANRIALDVLEQLIKEDEARGGPGRQLRHRIEHFQLVTPEDVSRVRGLGVLPSMQPTHATADMSFATKRLGPERLQEAYPWLPALQAAGALPLGSDAPYASLPSPWLGLYAAVTRQDTEGQPAGGWLPQYRLSRAQALKGYTLDAAYAVHREDVLGSIAPGKWADFVLLDRDVLDTSRPPSELLHIQVLATYVGGRLVYQATPTAPRQ